MCEIDTGAGSSFSEGLDNDNSISELILSNNLSYSLCSFKKKLVYLEKFPHQKWHVWSRK